MSEVVSYELIDNIGVISVNNPPVNALAQVVREGIHTAIQSAQQDESEAIVLYCEGRTFIAGADITEFGKPPQEPGLPVVLGAIENSSKAVIAAIHGTALGGGFEVSLACHYRCAIPSAKVGLPEVKLGLLPGAGGTQRAPRIAGVKAALDMITSGNPVGASKALEMGLIDKVIDGSDLKAGALQYAKELVGADAPLRRIRDITIDPSTVEEGYFEAARKQLARRARGQIAQDKIVSCIEAAVELPMDQGLERERELFVELVTSPESAAMRHIFLQKDWPRRSRTYRKILLPEKLIRWPLLAAEPWAVVLRCVSPTSVFQSLCWKSMMKLSHEAWESSRKITRLPCRKASYLKIRWPVELH